MRCLVSPCPILPCRNLITLEQLLSKKLPSSSMISPSVVPPKYHHKLSTTMGDFSWWICACTLLLYQAEQLNIAPICQEMVACHVLGSLKVWSGHWNIMKAPVSTSTKLLALLPKILAWQHNLASPVYDALIASSTSQFFPVANLQNLQHHILHDTSVKPQKTHTSMHESPFWSG